MALNCCHELGRQNPRMKARIFMFTEEHSRLLRISFWWTLVLREIFLLEYKNPMEVVIRAHSSELAAVDGRCECGRH